MPRRIAVVASERDKAGMNIIKHLEPMLDEASLPLEVQVKTVGQEIVYAERFPDQLEPRPDMAIFASRHESKSGRPCLTVHPPGNFGSADLGGMPGKPSVSAPHYMGAALRYLAEYGSDLPYEITMEATHHGPFTQVPCFFIEIGSRPDRWGDQDAGEVIARSIMGAIGKRVEGGIVVLGLGGPHYSRRFTKLMLETRYSVSHIVAKYAMGDFNDRILEELMEASRPRPQMAVMEWKGMNGSQREGAIRSLDEWGLEYRRLRDCLRGG